MIPPEMKNRFGSTYFIMDILIKIKTGTFLILTVCSTLTREIYGLVSGVFRNG
jgi:hypothetical protein